MASEYGIELLGSLPLDISIREATDQGKPSVVAAPDSPVAERYREIAQRIAVKVGEQAQDFSSKFPKIVIQNN